MAIVFSNNVVCAVSENFDLRKLGHTESGSTWLTVLEAVMEARTKVDQNNVPEYIWKAFVVYSWVLIPAVQGW